MNDSEQSPTLFAFPCHSLHLFCVEPSFLEKISGREALIERVARNKTAKTHLHERAQVTGRPVREVHDPARLAVDHKDMTFTNVCGFHRSGKLNPQP